MSKKKLEILTDEKRNYKGRFIDGLKAAGATETSAERFWEELLDFAKYAFNKSMRRHTPWWRIIRPGSTSTIRLNT